MITEYIELRESFTGLRSLVPIENVVGVNEREITEIIIENGLPVEKKVLKSYVILKGSSWPVRESYDDIKQQINKIRLRIEASMAVRKELSHEQ